MPVFLAVGPWWSFVVRGAAAVLFAVLTFALPGLALLTLVLLFGVYALAEGLVNVFSAFQRAAERQQPRWVLALEGVVSLGAGLLAFFVPGLTALSLLYLIAAWSLVTGVLRVVTAIRLRRELRGEWLLALGGVISIAFGFLLFIAPGAGALAVVLWIGAYALIFEALLIALGLRLRSWTHSRTPGGFDRLAHGTRA